MKFTSTLAITALCLSTTFASAGGLAPTVNDQVIILPEPAKSSAANVIVPLLVLGFIAAASGAGGTNSTGNNDNAETPRS